MKNYNSMITLIIITDKKIILVKKVPILIRFLYYYNRNLNFNIVNNPHTINSIVDRMVDKLPIKTNKIDSSSTLLYNILYNSKKYKNLVNY
jgi:hypothetical protein